MFNTSTQVFNAYLSTDGPWTTGSVHCLLRPNALGPDVAIYGQPTDQFFSAVTANTLIYTICEHSNRVSVT